MREKRNDNVSMLEPREGARSKIKDEGMFEVDLGECTRRRRRLGASRGDDTGVGSRLKATETGTRTGRIPTQIRRKWKQKWFYDVRYKGVTEYMHATPLHEIQIVPCMCQTRGEPEGQKHPVPMTT